MMTTDAASIDGAGSTWRLFDRDRLEILRGVEVSVSAGDAEIEAAVLRSVVDLLIEDSELCLFDVVPGLASCEAWMAAPLVLAPAGVERLTEHTCELLADVGISTWGELLRTVADELLDLEGLGFNALVGIVATVLGSAWLLGADEGDAYAADSAVDAFDEEERVRDLVFEAMVVSRPWLDLFAEGGAHASGPTDRAPGEGPVFGLGGNLPLASLFLELSRVANFTSGPVTWCPQGIEPISAATARLLEDLRVWSWGDVMAMHPSEMAESRWWGPSEVADLLRFMIEVASALDEPRGPER